MRRASTFALLSLLAHAQGIANADFNVLHHLGANSPRFAGPQLPGISPAIPDGCTVSRAAYIVRHGSRYPDQGAYNEWTALHTKLSSANFTATGAFEFLSTWKPVLSSPAQQIAQLSPGGYAELYELGVMLRTRYPEFYEYGSPFHLWANEFPRTVDSARLFARGYLGPNASELGTVYAINSRGEGALGNSLATSDGCPTFKDSSGGESTKVWDDIYLPPIVDRINGMIDGNLLLNTSDVSIFPYLCGFESQIARKRSPFCDVFTEEEIMQYEYRQDLRYYYGTGPGAGRNASVMLPVLEGVIESFSTDDRRSLGNETVPQPRLIVAFTHDNQINELASITGVFDAQRPLSATESDPERLYVSSRINPMRGTVAFERMSCKTSYSSKTNSTASKYIRILLNDAVYPVASCDSGPGRSCELSEYARLVQRKYNEVTSFASLCTLNASSVTQSPLGGVTFFHDLSLRSMRKVVP